MHSFDYAVEISARIKKYRVLNHMTQEQLASKLGLTTQHYAQLERTKRRFTLDHIISLCGIFNIPITDIVVFTSYNSDDTAGDHDADKKLILENISTLLSTTSYTDLLIVQRIIEDILLLSH